MINTEFVGLNESSRRKEEDKYSCNILSLDNGRMMITLKEEEKKNIVLKKIPRSVSKMESEMN